MRLSNAMTKTAIDKGQSPPRAATSSSSCSSSVTGDADCNNNNNNGNNNNNNNNGREVKDDILKEKILAEHLRMDIKDLMRKYQDEEDAEGFRMDFLQLPSVLQVIGDGGVFDDLNAYMEDETIFKFNVMVILVQRMMD